MPDPWMMLDIWGNPIHVDVLRGLETRTVSLQEITRIAKKGNGRWGDMMRDLVAKHEEGDTILWYNTPKADWDALMGSRGYVLVRDDFYVASVVEAMN